MEKLIKRQFETWKKIKNNKLNYGKDSKTRRTLCYMNNRIKTLNDAWDDFKSTHSTIIVDYDEPTGEDIDKNVARYFKYENDTLYTAVEEFVIDFLSELEETRNELWPQVKVPIEPAPTTTIIRETTNANSDNTNLPKINLPKFNGDYRSWTSFHDLFTTLIHKNKSLSNVQRLHYLKSSLQGEAEQLLRHYTITETNYTAAWSTLKERFENRKVLIKYYLKTLFSQPVMSKDSASNLRKLLDTTNECTTALQHFGMDIAACDKIFTYIVTERLPPETKKLWEQQIGTSKEFPTYGELKTFIEGQFRALEALGNFYSKPAQRLQTQSQSFHISKDYSCVLCSGPHSIRQCQRFSDMNYQSKREFVSKKGLCSNCLSQGHRAAMCPSRVSCFKCKHRHHTLLHDDNAIASINTRPSSSEPIQSSEADNYKKAFHVGTHSPRTLLPTANVRVLSESGREMIVRAFIDQGSEGSFVSNRIVQQLQLKKIPITTIINGVGNHIVDKSYSRVQFMIQSLLDNNIKVPVQASSLGDLTGLLPSANIYTRASWTHLNNLQLADAQYYKPGKIDIIIGVDVFGKIIRPGLRVGPPGTPIAQQTSLGWIISGETNTFENKRLQVTSLFCKIALDNQLKQFWELEEVTHKTHLTPEEIQCEKFYNRTVKRREDGSFEVRLPFKDETTPFLGRTRPNAMSRFYNLERKFYRDSNLHNEYSKCIEEYLTLDHMKPVKTSESEQMIMYENTPKYTCNYVPHHAVFKESSTTKLRVVFDASARGNDGVSLNEKLLVGPNLQDDIWTLLTRWRKHAIVFSADLEKMYRQIKVPDEDAQYQRIIWRKNPNEQLQEYCLTTVTFGTSCAPYLAIKTIQTLARMEALRYPLASRVTLQDFYVDDLLSGTDDLQEAFQVQEELLTMMRSGGFNLRKWLSNKTELLRRIPSESREVDTLQDLSLQDGFKALGIFWCPKSDSLKYKFHLEPIEDSVTKRSYLSNVSKIFDPLGLLAPVIIPLKIFMQVLWLRQIDWDEQIPDDIKSAWYNFQTEVKALKSVTIPRWINYSKARMSTYELHGFCDASMQAYAAVIYARAVDVEGLIHTSLITAKSRVAPTKQISVPRLELCGAVLLARLYLRIKEALKIPNISFRAWTDSTIVINWLQASPSKWKVFVANRVAEIQDTIPTECWGHLATDTNPADLATRGVSPSQLVESRLWWKGPVWLQLDESQWPKTRVNNNTDLEMKVKVHTAVVLNQSPFFTLLSKYSSWNKLLRVTAYCFRFMRRSPEIHRNENAWISSRELQAASIFWIKYVQKQTFEEEIQALKDGSKLKALANLNPFLDGNGVLRVGGRLKNSHLQWEEKFPSILPSKHALTTLVVNEMHARTLHGGPQLTHSMLRKQYWIINGRNTVRYLLRKCVTCFRHKAKVNQQLMGSLPCARVSALRPFAHTGVDYCGPFEIRISKGRGTKCYKGYICVFVCFSTRAIHLEIASDLTTPAFLAALRRFTSRRGLITDLYSDCGTNFVGAKRVLDKEFHLHLQQLRKDLPGCLAKEGISWHFNPPGAPHFGGLWEAAVKSVKFHLKRVAKDTRLTFEEFYTLIVQIEACVNSRPLCGVTNDPNDLTALTPGHFLTGDALLAIPEPSYLDSKLHTLDRWQLLQRLTQQFWKRWHEEYLTQLQSRSRWPERRPNIAENNIVLIKNENMPPTKWLLARVLKAHAGSDGLVRVATLRTQNGVIDRPITKLCLLPIEDNTDIK